MARPAPYNDIAAFHELLNSSRRIVALCGAGLSASSGLPTFRGAGGLWRNHNATDLATPDAFEANPGLVWLFYGYRRHMALGVKPNPGHHALAALAKHMPDFLCLTQNVDGLSPRAGHPLEQLRLLHGSLFDIKCFNKSCDHIEHENYADPFFPAISAASQDVEPGKTLPLLDPYNEEVAKVPESEIPRCPKCKKGLLRPGVVWFNEMLDFDMLNEVDNWIESGKVDLMMVIGTSAVVHPAAGYIRKAQHAGAKVATINIDAEENPKKIRKGDFAFGGDAAELLPQLLEPIIGKIRRDGTFREPTKPEDDE